MRLKSNETSVELIESFNPDDDFILRLTSGNPYQTVIIEGTFDSLEMLFNRIADRSIAVKRRM